MSEKFIKMSAAEGQEFFLTLITEEELQNNVIELARKLGWVEFHPWDSRHSTSGYPDITMFHAGQKRILWAELKRQGKERTPAQVAFGELIKLCEGEYHLWQPCDWQSGEIERILGQL